MRRFLNWFSAGFAAFFSIPTFLILISWNAVPGEALYGLKIALEDVALAITIRTPLASTLSVGYTERRFSEANTLLSQKGSAVGYSLLVAEADESKNIIVSKQDTKQGAQLISKIEEYQKDIEQTQELIRQGRLAVPVKTRVGTETPTPTFQPATPVPAQIPTVTATPKPTPPQEIEPEDDEEEVIEKLEKAKEELEKIKEEAKNKLPEEASENAQENLDERREFQEESGGKGNQGSFQDNEDKERDNDDD